MASEFSVDAVPASPTQITAHVHHADGRHLSPRAPTTDQRWHGAESPVFADRPLPPFAGELDDLLIEIFSSTSVAREALSALNAQSRALSLVWEAHRRGVISLPDSVARTITDARDSWPSVLRPPTADPLPADRLRR